MQIDNSQDGKKADEAPPEQVRVDQTTITHETTTPSAFREEAVGIKPQLGLVTRRVGTESNSHGVIGLLFDLNFLRRAITEGGKPYAGISFGALYSHLGNPGSDFLGMNGDGGDRGTHFLMIPLDVKAGYTFSDVFRLTGHGGVNILYTNTHISNADSMGIDSVEARVDESSWDTSPNFGVALEFGIGKNVGVLVRPDWTFSSNDTFFTGTLGLDIPLS